MRTSSFVVLVGLVMAAVSFYYRRLGFAVIGVGVWTLALLLSGTTTNIRKSFRYNLRRLRSQGRFKRKAGKV